MEDYRLEQTGQEVQRILNGAAMDANLQAEVERATDAEGTLQDNIDAEEQARQDADGVLQQGIDDEAQRAKDAEEANAGEIEGIKALIPSTATPANKLADTNYVNSSIQTATAEYRGDYNVVTDLHLAIDATHAQIETLLPTVIAEADKNDYCYVMIPTSAQTPTEISKIERYKMTSEGWKFEYDVNNSTFTAEEWAAIKSGITSGLVAKLNALPTNADLLLLLAGKQDVLIFDSVPVPESNNPVKSGGVYSAIDDEKTARLNSDTAIHAELDGLQAKVPATASSDNKLVDQNQMNSSISTATATFRGDWNVVSDLHLAVDATRAQIAALLPTVISTADNNDYCYVEIPTSAETPTQIERVERYKFNGTAWGYEYVLNNSGFTADQWAAINSMITSGLVAKLSALPTNADLLAMLAQKQDNLTFDTTPTENSTNPVTSGGVFAADKALSDAIEAILLLIPSAASALNKLVDTALLNSSISTATATFRGTYNLVSDLGLGIDATEGQIAAALLSAISTADNNDYAFVQIPTSAETPAQIARTDRYKFNGTAWAFEYTLNTSGFTAQQWAAINSTITSALVAKLNDLPTAAELQEALGTLTSGITAINQKIPSTASQSNKLVDASTMESYIAQVINILDASFNVTSTDGHITLHITQVDGVITSVQVQSADIASAADLALKASQADLTALASRVTTAEGNITSLTGRMGTAETNIANLQQLYNNLQQSKPVPVTALPSTGQQQGVIYRLAGTTSYSDYMWNGSSWVLMATYNNAIDPRPKKASQNLVTSGGVFDNIGAFDVSELNATENPHTLAQYADLSSALAAIPTDYQKGGMSIKYVQTSDKYVQYRLMADTWSIDTNDWAIADERVYVYNPKFIEADVDKDNKILWGIQKDGNFFFGAGVPKQIQDYVNSENMFENIEWIDNHYMYNRGTLNQNAGAYDWAEDTKYSYSKPFFMKRGDMIEWDGNGETLRKAFPDPADACVCETTEVGGADESYPILNQIYISENADYYRFIAAKDTWVSCNILKATKDEKHFKWYRLKAYIPIDEKGVRATPLESSEVRDLLQQCKTREENPHQTGVFYTPQLCLLHFSDYHNDIGRLHRVLQFKKKWSDYIDDVIHTGDAAGNVYSSFDIKALELDGYKTMLNVIGNHDVYTNNYADSVSQKDKYDRYMKGMANAESINNNIASWGVVQPTGVGTDDYFPCYYYKDYSDMKVRLIVLDSMEYFGTGGTERNQVQLTWFISVLNNTPSDVHVIVADHYPPMNDLNDKTLLKGGFNRIGDPNYNSTSLEGQYIQDYVDAIDDYINGGGIFICWLCGHLHYDRTALIAAHPKQLFLLVPEANVSGNIQNRKRTVGEESEDLFNIVAVDTYTKVIRVARVGSKFDRDLQHQGTMCISYDTSNGNEIELLSSY